MGSGSPLLPKILTASEWALGAHTRNSTEELFIHEAPSFNCQETDDEVLKGSPLRSAVVRVKCGGELFAVKLNKWRVVYGTSSCSGFAPLLEISIS